MRMFNLIFTIAAVAALTLAQTPTPVARGKDQFKSACGFCHGEDATGARAPDLIRSTILNHDVNGDLLAPAIRKGSPDKGMPPFPSLTDAQVADIVAFLHNQAKVALESNRVSRDYPLSRLLTGDAAAGKTFFTGAGGCASCHSPTGDLAGISKKYRPLDLQQRFLYPGGPSKRTATVTLPGGQKIDGKLVHCDEFDISITDKDGWHRSWPKNKVKVEIHDPLAQHRALLEKYTDRDMHNVFAYLQTLK